MKEAEVKLVEVGFSQATGLEVATLVSVVWLGLVGQGCTSTGSSSAKPPNIVIVVMDTTRQDHLSCYGYERDTSPNLTKLLETSRVFRDTHSTSSWTSPAHASLFTGLYPVAHQTTQERWSLDADLTTLAEILGKNGYETLAVVGNPMLSREQGFDQGFATYIETWRERRKRPKDKRNAKGTIDMESADTIATRLANRKHDAPLFLFVNLIGPHSPYTSCGKFCRRFVRDPSIHEFDAKVIKYYLGEKKYSPEAFEHLNDLYDAEILQADAIVGQIIASMKKTGHWDNTMFVVTSDHGENIGDHGQIGHVFTLYESTTRIPLIIHYPRMFPPNTEDHAPAQLHDLFTTALHAAGVDPEPYAPQGIDLTNEEMRRDRPVLMEYYRPFQVLGLVLLTVTDEQRQALARYDRRLRAIIKDNKKLIWGSDGTAELYDLSTDPHELRNLSSAGGVTPEKQDLEVQLMSLVEGYRREARPQHEQATLEESTKEALGLLGYLQ